MYRGYLKVRRWRSAGKTLGGRLLQTWVATTCCGPHVATVCDLHAYIYAYFQFLESTIIIHYPLSHKNATFHSPSQLCKPVQEHRLVILKCHSWNGVHEAFMKFLASKPSPPGPRFGAVEVHCSKLSCLKPAINASLRAWTILDPLLPQRKMESIHQKVCKTEIAAWVAKIWDCSSECSTSPSSPSPSSSSTAAAAEAAKAAS